MLYTAFLLCMAAVDMVRVYPSTPRKCTRFAHIIQFDWKMPMYLTGFNIIVTSTIQDTKLTYKSTFIIALKIMLDIILNQTGNLTIWNSRGQKKSKKFQGPSVPLVLHIRYWNGPKFSRAILGPGLNILWALTVFQGQVAQGPALFQRWKLPKA